MIDVTLNDELPIYATEVQETVDLSELMNSNSDAEVDDETLIKTVAFSYALHCLDTVNVPCATRCKLHSIVFSA
ncbi:hypothetical protein TNCV_397141 [Trichonephila clavipes]|nr:hypothetical protein TNCV_397141 [Trichonephila clavipes]